MDRPWLYVKHPCPHCGQGFTARHLARHEPVCFVPRTLERLYVIGRVFVSTRGCYEWQHHLAFRDYGFLPGEGWAHVLALELALSRKLEAGEQANHACNNKVCVNVSPGHVYLGDQNDNMRDAYNSNQSIRDVLDQGRAKRREQQQAVTHCPQGHEYTPENTYMDHGTRVCRQCKRDKARERMREKMKTHRYLSDGTGKRVWVLRGDL